MSACADHELLLQGYLDGELDAANTMTFEAHLQTCVACSAELERLAALRRRIRAPGVRYEVPEQLRARIEGALRREMVDDRRTDSEERGRIPGGRVSSAGRPARRVFVPWVLSGAVAALAACLAFVMFVRLPGITISDELVASHVRSLQVTHITDVLTSDQHVVKPWFAGKVAFSPPVYELSDAGFPLVGGRLDYVGGKTVSAIVYRRRQHVINLFVWPASSAEIAAVPSRRDGYNLVGWRQGGLQFWAVSDVDPLELQRFRGLFMAHAGDAARDGE